MSTKALLILGLLFIIAASYFYASNDTKLARPNLAPSDIDYQAQQVKALQTDEQGQIQYQLTASQVTHYLNAQTAVLTDPNIVWHTKNGREVTMMAKAAQLDENKQAVNLTGAVKLQSRALTNMTNSVNSPLLQLTGRDFMGDLAAQQVTSAYPVVVEQGNNRFEAQKMQVDVANGNYAFDRVAMTFMPAR